MIVKPIPRIGRHLEVVDHNDCQWTSAKDNIDFLRKPQIIIPVSIKVKEDCSAGQCMQRPVEKPPQAPSTISME
jgi:hypothetical protein